MFELRAVDGTITRFRSDGRIDYVFDTNNNRVTAGYDALSRLTSLTHSSGASIAIVYNAANLITSVTDSAGRRTTYGYDATNTYLTTVTTSDAKITRYSYQTTGAAQIRHAMLSIERGGTTQFFTYDNNGRLDASSFTGNTQLVDYGYNSTGLVTVDEDVTVAGVTSLYFDHHGQVAKFVDPLGNISTNEFDKDLRLSKTVSTTGETNNFKWFSHGNLQSITDELGFTTSFTYDNPFRQLTSFTDAKGNRTSYTYDDKGNLLTTVYPNGTVESLGSYTLSGLPGNSTNRRGQLLTYTFNSLGQVTRQTFADGSVVTFTYDGRGNVSTAADSSGTTRYDYNFATDGDRLKRITYPNGRFLDYTYDTFGRRIRITDQDGFVTKYEYDSVGRLLRLRDSADVVLLTYGYDAAGRLSRSDKGNGTFTTYEYDAAGQLLSLKNWRNATSLNSKFDYSYDVLGRRVSMTTLDGSWSYTYDGIGQLIRAVYASANTSLTPNQDLQYFYDATGNRTRTVSNGVTTLYTANNMNQYVTVGGVAQSYDADGNLTFDGVNTYRWDQLNQLIFVSGPQGVTEYEYDAFGNRTAKVENGVRTAYLVDPIGLSSVMAEYKAGALNPVRNVYGLGLAARQVGNDRYFFDFDALGSTAGISSSSGTYANSYYYTPFGKSTAKISSLDNPFHFVGQFGVQLELNGMQFMRARYYKTDDGRFANQDPIRLSGGQTNYYSYVDNEPTSITDSSGLASIIDNLSCLNFAMQDAYGYTLTMVEISARTFLFSMLRVSAAMNHEPQPNLEPIYKNPCEAPPEKPKGGAQGGGGGGTDGGGILGFIAGAFDPNQKLPGTGYGPQSFVAQANTIPYRIDFENYATATAPAQYVTISDFLSSDLDWASFQLTDFGFGDQQITVPAHKQTFQTTRSMTYNGKTFDVVIEAGIRTSTGEVYASFLSLDPKTGLPPDVLIGFLPPENGTGRGLGHVSYTVRPKAGLPTGREIRNVALISFDYQLAIATDQTDPLDASKGVDPKKQALITIDAGLPTSTVAALPPVTTTASFPVYWSGNDDAGGSGIAGYDVYVSTNGGAYSRFLSNTTLTSTIYAGAFGNTYRFYSIAIDNTGQRQPVPATHQAQTTTQSVDPLRTKLILPMYEYPLSAPNTLNSWWQQVFNAANASTPITIIANPNSGPIDASHPKYGEWITALTKIRENPYIRILGYVSTRVAPKSDVVRPAAEILGKVQLYSTLYKHPITGLSLIDGIFLDEMSNLVSNVPTYITVATGIRANTGLAGRFIMGNVGTEAPVEYLDQNTADAFIIREGTPTAFFNNPTPAYVSSPAYSHLAFGAIVHGAIGTSILTQILREMKVRQFDYVFITDDIDDPLVDTDSPYDRSPAYFTELLRDIHAPYIAAATFNLAENSAAGTVVGTPVSGDPDTGQTVAYSITAGNANNAFAINAATGRITVNNSAALDFETSPTFNLRVRITDNGSPSLFDENTITIGLTNVNEAPVLVNPLSDQSIAVGILYRYTVPANTFSDPDGNVLTYTATLSDGSPLPSWLSFNPATRTLSGTSVAGNIGIIQIRVTATDPSLASASDVFQLSVAIAAGSSPRVESIVLNDGQSQRSKLKKVTITFDTLVNVAAGAVVVERRDDAPGGPSTVGVISNVVQSITTVGGKTVVTLTFAPSSNPSPLFPDIAGSLKDGNYQVTIDDLGITSLAGGLILDGNNDTLPGGDKVFGNTAVDRFYRLYGDDNGDGFVDLTDLNALVSILTLQVPYREWLDKNGDGFVDLTDLNSFVANLLNNNIRNTSGF